MLSRRNETDFLHVGVEQSAYSLEQISLMARRDTAYFLHVGMKLFFARRGITVFLRAKLNASE